MPKILKGLLREGRTSLVCRSTSAHCRQHTAFCFISSGVCGGCLLCVLGKQPHLEARALTLRVRILTHPMSVRLSLYQGHPAFTLRSCAWQQDPFPPR